MQALNDSNTLASVSLYGHNDIKVIHTVALRALMAWSRVKPMAWIMPIASSFGVNDSFVFAVAAPGITNGMAKSVRITIDKLLVSSSSSFVPLNCSSIGI